VLRHFSEPFFFNQTKHYLLIFSNQLHRISDQQPKSVLCPINLRNQREWLCSFFLGNKQDHFFDCVVKRRAWSAKGYVCNRGVFTVCVRRGFSERWTVGTVLGEWERVSVLSQEWWWVWEHMGWKQKERKKDEKEKFSCGSDVARFVKTKWGWDGRNQWFRPPWSNSSSCPRQVTTYPHWLVLTLSLFSIVTNFLIIFSSRFCFMEFYNSYLKKLRKNISSIIQLFIIIKPDFLKLYEE